MIPFIAEDLVWFTLNKSMTFEVIIKSFDSFFILLVAVRGDGEHLVLTSFAVLDKLVTLLCKFMSNSMLESNNYYA